MWRARARPPRRPWAAVSRARLVRGGVIRLDHTQPAACRQLLLNLRETLDIPDVLWVVYRGREAHVQINPLLVNEFLERVQFAQSAGQEAERIYPLTKGAPVVIDPKIASASPNIRGIRTEVIAERILANEPMDDVAEECGMTLPEVKAAVAYAFESVA